MLFVIYIYQIDVAAAAFPMILHKETERGLHYWVDVTSVVSCLLILALLLCMHQGLR